MCPLRGAFFGEFLGGLFGASTRNHFLLKAFSNQEITRYMRLSFEKSGGFFGDYFGGFFGR
jgi:hypothetical protein